MDKNAIKLLKDQIEPNSHSHKQKKEVEKRKQQSVVKGKVKARQVGKGHQVAEAFFGEDIDHVGNYILFDVIIPAVKNTLSDMVSGAVDMMLFGETRGRNTRRSGSKSYVSYNDYGGRNSRPRRDERSSRKLNKKNAHDFSEFSFELRGDAEEVLSLLIDNVDEYDVVSVADFYGFIFDEETRTPVIRPQDEKYGWDDSIRKARVERSRDGYYISFPRPKAIDV